jgi:D-threo-aldose 1-dehydrogenase
MYAEVADDDAQAAVRDALAAGLGYFDVAPLYGNGLAEQRLGRALRDVPRAEFVLSTKVGRLLVPRRPGARDAPPGGRTRATPAPDPAARDAASPEAPAPGAPAATPPALFAGALPFDVVFDYTRDGVLRSLDESCRRLGLDRIDVVLIHDVNRHWQGEDLERRFREAMDGAFPALAELRARGEIGAIGVGVNDAGICVRFARAGDFDCFMLAGRYTLLDQSPLDDLLPLCAERGIGLLAAAPFNSGILATGATPGAKYFYRSAPPEILERTTRIEALCRRHGVPLAAAALQFPLAHRAVTSVVTGHRSAEEVRTNARLLAMAIPGEFWQDMRSAGLLRPDAPTP